MNKDAFYFPHFSNARHDRKMRRLRKELGIEGYGIFFMLLEILRDQPDYSYPLHDVDLLAEEFNTSEQKIRTVICKYDLFIIDGDQCFFSSKLLEYLEPFFKMKAQRSLAGKKSGEVRKLKATNNNNLLNDRSTDDERKRTKERKGNKGKETKYTNNKNSLSEKFPDDAIEFILSKKLFDLILKNNPKAKTPNLKTWSKTIDLMIRIDKRSTEDIEKVIEWCQTDNFWSKNILSTDKLRKQFDQLYVKMMNKTTSRAEEADSEYQRKIKEAFEKAKKMRVKDDK